MLVQRCRQGLPVRKGRTITMLRKLHLRVQFFMDMRYKATLMDEISISRALKRISHEILEKNNGAEGVCIIGIKRRGIPLAQIIANNIEAIEGTKVPVGCIDITFYRDDLSTRSRDPIVQDTNFPFEIEDQTVILVDDVLFTGRTARAAMDGIMQHGRPASIQFATLIDRGHRELPIRGDYVGKNVPTSKSERIAVKIPPYDEVTCVELYDSESI